MKIHTTNYQDTFIEIADDCPTASGEVPPTKGDTNGCSIQFEMVSKNQYEYTSDDICFRLMREISKSGRFLLVERMADKWNRKLSGLEPTMMTNFGE